MRNALILTGVWLGILVTAYAIVFWDNGIDRPLPISVLEEQAQISQTQYVHPDGLFSIEPPMGWSWEEQVAYVELADPNETITVWIVAVDVLDPAGAVDLASAIAGHDLEGMTMTSGSLPEVWSDDELSVVYSNEEDSELTRVQIRRPHKVAVVMLSNGPEKALEALSENMDWIWSELAVPAEAVRIL